MMVNNKQYIERVATRLEFWIEQIGAKTAVLVLLMVLVEFLVVILSSFFNTGWIAMQESVLYMHSMIFLLGAAYTLKLDGHVRVDILYSKFNPKTQAWVNLLGVVLLLWPVCGFIFWASWDYVMVSWQRWESSVEAGGLPIVYLLKTFILIFSALLVLQGVAVFLRNLLGLIDTSHLPTEQD